ncbi:MAG: hypothetical protein HY053_08510 [Proteobacteria bacterium]|nr:hypothetical protein [Pseudomonadota bacterium]
MALLEQAAQAQRSRSGQFASGGSRLVGWYMDDHTGVAAPIIKGHDMADGLMAPFGGRAIHIAAAIPGPALRDGSIAPRPPVTDFHNAVKLENRARARSRERGKAFARNGFSLPIPGTMQQAKTAGSIRITSAQLRPSMIPFASLLFADDEFDEGPSYMGFSGHGQHKLEP